MSAMTTCSNSGVSFGCVPRFDVLETDHELVLMGDLPGVAPEDLEVSCEDRELTIRGQRRSHADVTYLRQEFQAENYERVYQLSDAIDVSRISAELKLGVLTVHLPKVEAVKPRKIEVQLG